MDRTNRRTTRKRMGHDTVTIKNKRIVGIKENILLISGPLPGSNGDLVKIYTE